VSSDEQLTFVREDSTDQTMQKRRDAWMLGALLVIFVASSAYFNQRSFENQQKEQPTTYSVGKGGTKALYQLLDRQGFRTQRYERPLGKLPDSAGVLVMVEPLARPMKPEEIASLQEWLNGGGTLLLVASADWVLRAVNGVDFEEATVERKTGDSSPVTIKAKSPFVQDVGQLQVLGNTRFSVKKKDKVTTLAEDKNGPVLVTWKEEKGRVILASEGLAPNNGRLLSGDNAVFFVNIAQAQTSAKRPTILFDEFHQGFGDEEGSEKSLWSAIGPAMQMAIWYAAFGFLIILYNANRRFGAAKILSRPEYRPSTEYISSMAGLYRRAGAGEIALETIYRAFLRDLSSRVDALPDASAEQIVALSVKRFGWDAEPLRELLRRCEQVIAPAPAGAEAAKTKRKDVEAEMLRLAKQIEDYRNKAELNRLR
jgi:hypothetical protein